MEKYWGLFWVLLILQSFIFGGFCSFVAAEKNRNALNWFFLGFLFSVIALLALIGVPRIEKDVQQDKVLYGSPSGKRSQPQNSQDKPPAFWRGV